MYYLLAGENVFRGQSTMEVCAHHLHSKPVPISERSRAPLSQELATLVMNCLAKDPAQRPQTAEAVLERLQACPEAGAWVGRDARTWWATQGTRLSARRTQSTGSAQSTMAIDLQNRNPSSGARS